MAEAFNNQFNTFHLEPKPWEHVRGPATAVMANLSRIRWYPASYDKWVTDKDEIIDLTLTIP